MASDSTPGADAPHPASSGLRLGVDLGGTKIAAALLGQDGATLEERRIANPGGYDAVLVAIRDLCDGLVGREVKLGIGMPGSISPVTRLVRNANSTYLNGRNFAADLAGATGRQVRLANDANCFALSESVDGAGAGAASVFGVIIGTGVGGGLVVRGELVEGAGGVAGEWGHIPLPWAEDGERQAQPCWCGLRDCMELWASGTGFEKDYGQAGVRGPQIVERARAGETAAKAALDRYISRLARGLAVICNVFDPNVIVLGGGMSNVDELYTALPEAMRPYQFTDQPANQILRNRHGDASGVRGAAWLWPR